MSAVVAYGGPQHRIAKVPVRGVSRIQLRDDHPALARGETIFPSTVVSPEASPRLLVPGFNSRKTGGRVTKGAWRGCRIFTLTLEERATCPRACAQWRTCYGNNMHLARRHAAGDELERLLPIELAALARAHPAGFVVRLHILGDFYSADYVAVWARALATMPALRVFGYTAHAIDSEIGAAIAALSFDHPDRCRVRFSGSDYHGLGSLVIERREDSQHVLCPAQIDLTDCCATCALCWTMNEPVEFLRH